MSNKPIRITLLIILILIVLPKNIFATTLYIKTMTDNEQYKVGDKVKVTINWEKPMQAASYTIKYDSERLKLENSNISDTFYNLENVGEIKINWVSMEEKDFTKMTFEFKTVKAGEANIAITNVEDFADGNLTRPNSYDFSTYGNRKITIKETISKNTNEDNKKEEDNTTANGKLPQTGIQKVLFVFIALLFIFGTIGFIKYKKLYDI